MSGDLLGIDAARVSSEAEQTPGLIADEITAEYVYCLYNEAVDKGEIVILSEDHEASLFTHTLAATRFGDRVGVCMSDIQADQYGWVLVRGEAEFQVGAECAPHVPLHASSVDGQLDDDPGSGTGISNIIITQLVGALPARAPGYLLNPIAGRGRREPARELDILEYSRSQVSSGTPTGDETLAVPMTYEEYDNLEIIVGDDGNVVDVLSIPTAWLALQEDGDDVQLGILDKDDAGNQQWITWTPSTRAMAFGRQSSGSSTNPRFKAARLYDNGTAASSSGGADATARAAAAAAQTTADAALPKSGGTMTGKIVLDGAPTSNLHAATKAYVDSNSGSTDATARAAAAAAQSAADEAQSTADAAASTASDAESDADTAQTAASAAATAAAAAGRAAAAAATTANAALPRTGGAMTGKITLDGAPTANNHAATKAYVDSNSGSDFTPSQENLYAAVKAIFHPSTNSGVAADDDNSELDVTGDTGTTVGMSLTDIEAVTVNSASGTLTTAYADLPDVFAVILDSVNDTSITASERYESYFVEKAELEEDGGIVLALGGQTGNYVNLVVDGTAVDWSRGNFTGQMTIKSISFNAVGLSTGSNVPNKPADPDEDTRYVLLVEADGSASWVTARFVESAVQDDLEQLQHLTRDLHAITPVTEWEDAADTDGDLFWTVPVNNAITLTDANFDNKGASITIPESTSPRTNYVFVRVTAETDVTPFRLFQNGHYSTANVWARAEDEGVTIPTGDTYHYWMAVINLNETAAETWKLQKRDTLASSRFDGELGGEALRLARNENRFEALEHLTRDLHTNEPIPTWEDAADSEGDLFQVLDPGSAVTLTDANFDNNGATIQIPDGQNADTLLYARLPAASDHKLYRITFDDREPRAGHTWVSVSGPDETTYQYWYIYSVNNFGFSFVQLEKHTAIEGTTFTGDGAAPAGGSAGQALTKRTNDDYDVQWNTPQDNIARTVARAALSRAGGTMTGKITLDGAPTSNLHAATKKYVDDNAGGSGGSSNVPNSPAAGSTDKKYNLVVDTDGDATWEDDLSQNFAEFDTLPDVDDFNINDIIGFNERLYKLATTSADSPNLYEATVGRDNLHIGDVYWRGVAGSQSPNGFTTDGGFSANPNNAIIMVMASSDRHMRVIVKQSVFESFKGSSFVSTDKLHMTLALESGDSDIVTLNYYSAYERETHYLIFQVRHASSNYHLYGEAAGNNMGMTFRVGSNTGNQFAHAVDLLHWLEWPSDPHQSDGGTALALAQANKARLDALDAAVDGGATTIHDITYDDTTALLAPLAGSAGDNAVETTYTDVKRGDLLVFDWTKCEHLNDHSEHVLPGSTTDAGRMYVSVDQFNNVEWDGEFIYATDRAIQDNGSADTLNSWIVGTIIWNAPNLTFGLHLQQGGTRANRNLKAQAGFSLRMRVFRNTTPALATSGSIHAQLAAITAQLDGLTFSVLTDAEYTALATKDDDTIYFTTAT